MSAVDLIAVEPVLEASACPDRASAEAALAGALGASSAPRRSPHAGGGWTVSVRVSRLPGAPVKSAEASIRDDTGALVAERTLTDRAAQCTPLARAVGVWASLVLDEQVRRAHDPAPSGEDAIVAERARPAAVGAGPHVVGADDPDRAAGAPRVTGIEVGASAYLRGGDGSGVAGLSPFMTIEVSRGWVLRPSVMLGRSTAPAGGDISHGGGRVDVCRRIPGNYIERRGIELDVCGGADAGVSRADPIVTAGPSMVLRGELGAGLAVELRGTTGIVIVEAVASADPPVMGAAELGMSWRLP